MNTMVMTTQESRSCVWLRVFAMFTIIICHLFQAYHKSGWSDIFNMGVQVFLVLSGYLYGHKHVDNWNKWFGKRFNKLYIPYLTFLVCVIPLYFLFHNEAMNWKVLPIYFANLDGFRFLKGGAFWRIEGLRHVWFLTAIMCAYLTTPLLQCVKHKSKIAFPILILMVAIAYVLLPLRYVFVLSWVYLYMFGYLYVTLDDVWKRIYEVLIVIGMAVLIYKISWENMLHPYSMQYRLIHDVAGLFIIIIGVRLLSLIPNISVPTTVSFFDKWSFHIYIVHFIIMCGPFSLSRITPLIWLNVIIMLAVTAICTYIFVRLLNIINKCINNKFSNKFHYD